MYVNIAGQIARSKRAKKPGRTVGVPVGPHWLRMSEEKKRNVVVGLLRAEVTKQGCGNAIVPYTAPTKAKVKTRKTKKKTMPLRPRGASLSIGKVLEIADFIEGISASGGSIGKLVLAEFSESLKGWKRFAPCRFLERVKKFRLREVPVDMRGARALPNWWRAHINAPRLGKGEEWGMPMIVQQHLDKIIGQRAVGAYSGETARVSNNAIARTAQQLAQKYNAQVDWKDAERTEHNAKLLHDLENEIIPSEDAVVHYQPPVTQST